ncbi:MAG: response regulator [bacterium]
MRDVRVVVVDDHPAVREGLRSGLSAQRGVTVVGDFAGEECLSALTSLEPDVVLLDIGLGDQSGLRVLERIRRSHPGQAVVILSMYTRNDFIQEALRMGARGYLSKESPTERVTAAVLAAATGLYAFDEPVASILIDRLAAHASKPRTGISKYDLLTPREQQVFRLLAEGYSTKETAAHLSLAHRTVENYQTSIYHKLDLSSPAELVRLAIELDVI